VGSGSGQHRQERKKSRRSHDANAAPVHPDSLREGNFTSEGVAATAGQGGPRTATWSRHAAGAANTEMPASAAPASPITTSHHQQPAPYAAGPGIPPTGASPLFGDMNAAPMGQMASMTGGFVAPPPPARPQQMPSSSNQFLAVPSANSAFGRGGSQGPQSSVASSPSGSVFNMSVSEGVFATADASQFDFSNMFTPIPSSSASLGPSSAAAPPLLQPLPPKDKGRTKISTDLPSLAGFYYTRLSCTLTVHLWRHSLRNLLLRCRQASVPKAPKPPETPPQADPHPRRARAKPAEQRHQLRLAHLCARPSLAGPSPFAEKADT
jgi:hypothetical protein